ncbi:hydantoinase B/oxoprolinase family protein [Aminobacter sp. SR38]|jgi:N-methylhydantoinase B|uniref:hydantoinase B/oxoprolinase family protein n=1 Tax=Aminobacter sp. SR38 TaxID=2774562 RepID=UPI00177CAB12|nr:hydantoinase B/oxoprolinase family protein [Aminobacter sp. SR38]QOF69766.1 hydantoinase B/oxoprolinase family protein [Aminobacter sp. SR38]
MTIGPIELEIIRHRLEAINADAGETLVRVSGSQIASEASDFNTAIMTADGTVISCSKFILVQSTSLNLIVRDILDRYGENPGIGRGDQFLTNDPYLGALHQPDVTLVAPIFHGDRLIAWAGSTVHEPDVGGPISGGFNYAARSIFDEAIPIPPVKIVEAGSIRRDIERDYLARTRTPELNALDLLGQIAANRASERQVLELCAAYGTDGLVHAMDRLLASTEAAFRRRLIELPDGIWRENSFIQHEQRCGADYLPNQVYAVRLAMTKTGDKLSFDFTASDDQAPGAVNSTYPTLANFTMAAVLVHICQGLPWMPGAIWRTIDIRTRKGSIVDAEWPAGVAMSTGTSAQAIRNCVSGCLARLLDGSAAHAHMAMASSQSSGAGGMSISGHRRDGTPFTTLFLDELSGGGGATVHADGSDTSGTATSPGATPSNLETNEAYYPVLYLTRRELADSGGPGMRRGGVGAMHAYRPHQTDRSIALLSMAQGLQHPATMGAAGGEPGLPSGFAIMSCDVPVAVSRGWAELADATDFRLPDAATRLYPDQILVTSSQGGGGFGDPLERDPAAVAMDVLDGLVSVGNALRDFGVVLRLDGDQVEIDRDASEAARKARLKVRLGGRDPRTIEGPVSGRRLSSHFRAVAVSGGEQVVCAVCGHGICDAGADIYASLAVHEAVAGERSAITDRYPGSERFRIRHFYCPGCARQVDVQVALSGDPVLEAIELPVPRIPTETRP